MKTVKRFEDCIPVKGLTRSNIMDLPRKNYFFIPNDLYTILNTNKLIYDLPLSYKDYLREKEFIHECNKNQIKNFPKLNTKWDLPCKIYNIVLEISKKNYLSVELINKFVSFGCKHIVIIIQNDDFENLEKIIRLFNKTIFLTIEVYLKFSQKFDEKILFDLLQENNRLSFILLFSAYKNEIISKHFLRGNLIYYQKEINYSNNNICIENLVVNIPLYTEALNYNPFFNRKLTIDSEGKIKNYLNQDYCFGNIYESDIESIISSKKFQKLWYIHKGKIDICSSCEFRYMCIDSRIPKRIKNLKYSFDTKCSYNPYICKWDGQEGYIPVEECGTYNRETGFVPDIEKINELNKLIWGEDE